MLRQVWGTICPSVVFSGRTLKAKAGGQGPEHQSTRFTFSASNVCFWSLAGSQTSKVFCLPPTKKMNQFSSVQFSRSIVSDSLRPHESQHTRPPCPSPTPRVYSDSCPSSRWCHPAISSSVVPFSSRPQSLPASGSFPMSELFARKWIDSSKKTSWVFSPHKFIPYFLYVSRSLLVSTEFWK